MTMKIGTRLALTFSAVLILLLMICVVVSAQMSRMNANTHIIVKKRNARIALTNQTKEGTYLTALLIYRTLDEPTPEAQQADLEQLQDNVKQNSAHYKEIESQLSTADGQAAFAHLMQVREAYSTALRPVY